mgnify:FL=1|jgi:hypothetical protein
MRKTLTHEQIAALKSVGINHEQLTALREAGLIDEVFVSPKEELVMLLLEDALPVKTLAELIDVRPATYSTYTNDSVWRVKLWRRVLDKIKVTPSEEVTLCRAHNIISRIREMS